MTPIKSANVQMLPSFDPTVCIEVENQVVGSFTSLHINEEGSGVPDGTG
jgi:hypothetical protein